MNTKSKLKAISIGIAAIIMMVSLFAVMAVSASVVTDCWIGDDNKVYFTIYSDAKAEGYARLYVDGAYKERKKFSLNAGETRTLSFRTYRWSDCEDVEVCVDSSCCNPIAPTPPTTGAISIQSSPSGATIYLEGFVGPTVKTPHTFTKVSPGHHNLKLSLDGYYDWGPKEVDVTAGETTLVHATMIPKPTPTPTPTPTPPSPGPDLVTDCWIGDYDKVYFTVYSGEKVEGYARLNVDGAYTERKKFSLRPGETRTLSFRTYRWNGVDDVEVCVDNSCCNPIAPPPPPPPGEYWAVIVGVSNYAELNDLNYCDDDANDIYSRLLSYDNWKASNIMLLIDSAATKANIHNAIDWMKTKADADDICLFLFSGHGSRETDIPPYDEADGRDEYLCPHDSLLAFVTNDIRDDELDDWMTPIKGKKVVLLDTCFSGGFVKTPGYTIKTKPGIPYMKPTGKMLGDGFTKDLDKAGYVTLTASQDTEYSYECSALENGVFSYYVDEGLAGPANADDDLDISAEETYDYANPKVVSYYTEQHPQIYDGVTGELPVVKW